VQTYYKRTPATAGLAIVVLVFGALAVADAATPGVWDPAFPPGSLFVALAGIAAYAVAIGVGSILQWRDEDYHEYVLDGGELGFTDNHLTLDRSSLDQPWYPRRPGGTGAAGDGDWRIPYSARNFVRLDQIERLEETAAGLEIDAHTVFQRVIVSRRWAGADDLVGSIAYWRDRDDRPFETAEVGDREIELVIDNRRLLAAAAAAKLITVRVTRTVYGYLDLRRRLIRATGIELPQARRSPLPAITAAALFAVTACGSLATADSLLRLYWACGAAIAAPVLLAAAHPWLRGMRLPIELAALVAVPATLLYLTGH
jgi:hypothetical protein